MQLAVVVGASTIVFGALNDTVEAVRVARLSGILVVLLLTAIYFWREDLLHAIRRSRHPRLAGLALAVGAVPGALASYLVGHDLYVESQDSSRTSSIHEIDRGEDYSGQTISHVVRVAQNLSNSDFTAATLRDVDLDRATLDESSFRGAQLINVNLAQASLCGTDLRDADLRGAVNIDQVRDWRFAVYNSATRWPRGFRIEHESGPIREWTGSLLLSCQDGSWSVRPLAELDR